MLITTKAVKQNKTNGIDWPKEYTCNFLEAGLVSYEDAGAGIAMLRKETILKMMPTFVGKPVVINHVDVTPFDFKNHAVGYVTKVWFDDASGWACCSFLLTDDVAKSKVAQGYSVSCAYDVIKTGAGGDWHAIKYDEEILEGSGTHLALVTSPRYEDCRILVNSKKAVIKEGEGKRNDKEPDREAMFAKEKGEHPELPDDEIKKIVEDHIAKSPEDVIYKKDNASAFAMYSVYYMDNDRQKKTIATGLTYQQAVSLCQKKAGEGITCEYEAKATKNSEQKIESKTTNSVIVKVANIVRDCPTCKLPMKLTGSIYNCGTCGCGYDQEMKPINRANTVIVKTVKTNSK